MGRVIAGPDDVGFLIVDTARLLRSEFERQVEEAGLSVTPGEARLLIHLNKYGLIRQHVLAGRLGISKMTLTNYVDRLEAAGLVARSDDATDRRAKIVSVTPDAEAVLGEIAKIGKAVRRTARGTIGDSEWKSFSAMMLEVRGNLSAARAESPFGRQCR